VRGAPNNGTKHIVAYFPGFFKGRTALLRPIGDADSHAAVGFAIELDKETGVDEGSQTDTGP
jgi:hypothetical protein